MNRLLTSGLIVPVEAARELVAPWAGFVPAPSRALPPHVPALWPFLPADALDDALERRLAALLEGQAAFDFSLARVAGLTDGVVLVPEPADPFVALTRLLWDEWPECPPFGGVYDVVAPRLTVAHDPGPADRSAIQAAIGPRLPLAARAAEVLLVEEDEGGALLERRRFALGGPAA
jgi:hypothetical protein